MQKDQDFEFIIYMIVNIGINVESSLEFCFEFDLFLYAFLCFVFFAGLSQVL